MLALVNGKILTISHGVIESGTVLIENGRIAAVGPEVKIPAGAQVVDCQGKVIMPGLIDANSRVSVREDGNGPIGHDDSEMYTPIAPELKAIDAVWPEDLALQDAIKAGVTCLSVGPSPLAIIGGQSATIKPYGKTVNDMVVKEPDGLKVSLSGTPRMLMFFGGDGVRPRDRSEDIAQFQAALQRAKESEEKQARAAAKAAENGKEPPAPDRNSQQEVLIKLLSGKLPARIAANQNHDIDNALEIAGQWGFNLILEGGADAHLMVDKLTAKGVPVILGSLTDNRRGDTKNLSLKTPAILANAGVKVSLSTNHPNAPIRYLMVQAALAVQGGMTEEQALRALTLTPAEILGIADRVGSIEPGKDADMVILSGEPLRTKTVVERVFINGQEVYVEGGR